MHVQNYSRALVAREKGIGGSILAPAGEGERPRDSRQMLLANSWCQSRALGFVVLGTFEGKGLTSKGKPHLTNW